MRRILITFLAAETFLHQEKVKQKDQRENSLLYSHSSNTIVLGRDIRTEICREVVTQRSLSIHKLAFFRFSWNGENRVSCKCNTVYVCNRTTDLKKHCVNNVNDAFKKALMIRRFLCLKETSKVMAKSLLSVRYHIYL